MHAAAGLSSMLFVPGGKPERYAKALNSAADAVCIDLEDSVPAADKAMARKAALDSIAEGDSRLVLRINGVATRAGLEDILALADATVLPPLLFLPMVENVAEIGIVTAVLGDKCPPLVPLIETVKGLEAAGAIASAPGVAAMMFGGGDFSAELGVALAWEPLRTARGLFIMACARAGVPAIDVPFIALDDAEGLVAEAAAAKAIGFTGKAAIHPAQIDPINQTFRPTPDEIAEAEEAQQVFEAANGAAVRFKGRMLEAPIMRRYQRILEQRNLAMRSNKNA